MSAWFSPDKLEDALTLLDAHPAARLIAGGTDLLVGLRREPCDVPLVSLDRVAELTGIVEADEDGMLLSIGATTRIAELAGSALLAERAPLLQRAAREFAAPAIRNMATMGGNLCTASPAGDCLPPLYALGAQVELVSLAGRRRLPIADFVVAPGRTALTQGEVVARVLLPAREYFAWQSYEKVGRRRSLAITVVSFAGLLRIDDAQRVAAAHFAWGAVAPTVVCAPEVAAVLTGRTLEPALIEQAVERARAAVAPIDDLRAGADYRRALAGNLLRRFLLRALSTQVPHG